MASSMSQVHFGHYMAGMFNLMIAVLNAKMAEMPLVTRHTPSQWKKGLNIATKK